MKWYTHNRAKYMAITEKESDGNPKWDVARTYTAEHARLISSAPDLLEAVKSARKKLSYPSLSQKTFGEIRDILTDAIFKATGSG